MGILTTVLRTPCVSNAKCFASLTRTATPAAHPAAAHTHNPTQEVTLAYQRQYVKDHRTGTKRVLAALHHNTQTLHTQPIVNAVAEDSKCLLLAEQSVPVKGDEKEKAGLKSTTHSPKSRKLMENEAVKRKGKKQEAKLKIVQQFCKYVASLAPSTLPVHEQEVFLYVKDNLKNGFLAKIKQLKAFGIPQNCNISLNEFCHTAKHLLEEEQLMDLRKELQRFSKLQRISSLSRFLLCKHCFFIFPEAHREKLMALLLKCVDIISVSGFLTDTDTTEGEKNAEVTTVLPQGAVEDFTAWSSNPLNLHFMDYFTKSNESTLEAGLSDNITILEVAWNNPIINFSGNFSDKKVLVKNLPMRSEIEITEALEEAFSMFGKLTNVEVIASKVPFFKQYKTSEGKSSVKAALADKFKFKMSPLQAVIEFESVEAKQMVCKEVLRVFGVKCKDRFVYPEPVEYCVTLAISQIPISLSIEDLTKLIAFELHNTSIPNALCNRSNTSRDLHLTSTSSASGPFKVAIEKGQLFPTFTKFVQTIDQDTGVAEQKHQRISSLSSDVYRALTASSPLSSKAGMDAGNNSSLYGTPMVSNSPKHCFPLEEAPNTVSYYLSPFLKLKQQASISATAPRISVSSQFVNINEYLSDYETETYFVQSPYLNHATEWMFYTGVHDDTFTAPVGPFFKPLHVSPQTIATEEIRNCFAPENTVRSSSMPLVLNLCTLSPASQTLDSTVMERTYTTQVIHSKIDDILNDFPPHDALKTRLLQYIQRSPRSKQNRQLFLKFPSFQHAYTALNVLKSTVLSDLNIFMSFSKRQLVWKNGSLTEEVRASQTIHRGTVLYEE